MDLQKVSEEFETINVNTIDYELLIKNIKKLKPKNAADLFYSTWYSLSTKRLYRAQTIEILDIIVQLDNYIKSIRYKPSSNGRGISSAGYKQYKEIKKLKCQEHGLTQEHHIKAETVQMSP
jgi:hypothetical protein